MNVLAAAAIGFCVTLLAILALRPLAKTIDLVDRPGGRKTHDGDVPLIGGLAMFLGLVAGLGFMDPFVYATASLVGVSAILVVIGLLDDRFELSRWMRLVVHVVAAVALIAGTGALVTHLGDPFGTGIITLHGFVTLVFTVLLITMAVNAFNMLDGMDGLAGGTALAGVSGLALLAWLHGGSAQDIATSGLICAAICGFLVFNVPAPYVRGMRCFMGDAGSTLLGALVAWLCIRTSQSNVPGAVHPVTVLWVVGLPLFEIFWTVIRRISRGRSPMMADREHFHHVLLGAGFSVRDILLVLGLVNVALIGMGVALSLLQVPDAVSLVLLILTGIAWVRLVYQPQWLHRILPDIGASDARAEIGSHTDSTG